MAEPGLNEWDHSPDHDVLTPQGLRTYLHVGLKAYNSLIRRPGFPKVRAGTSYRFVKFKVLEWLADQGNETDDPGPN